MKNGSVHTAPHFTAESHQSTYGGSGCEEFVGVVLSVLFHEREGKDLADPRSKLRCEIAGWDLRVGICGAVTGIVDTVFHERRTV